MNLNTTRLKSSIELLKYGVKLVAGVTLFKEKVGDLRWCEGASMLPTLNVTGDLLLQIPISSILNYEASSKEKRRRNLNRGDLVNFTSPINPRVLACKRIIGIAGDKILVDEDKNGPNLNPMSDFVVHNKKSSFVIPEGHLWLEGDNSAVSVDSRTYGPVPIALVSGKIIARVWPSFDWLSQPFEFKNYHQK